MLPLRFYLFAGLAAFIAFALWHDHHVSKLLKARTAELTQVRADAAAELENTRKAYEADKRNTTRQDALQTDKVANPLPAVIVYRGVRQCPVVPQSGTTAVTDEAPKADDAGAHADGDSRDLGPALDKFATDAESNLIQCQELQTWLISR